MSILYVVLSQYVESEHFLLLLTIALLVTNLVANSTDKKITLDEFTCGSFNLGDSTRRNLDCTVSGNTNKYQRANVLPFLL